MPQLSLRRKRQALLLDHYSWPADPSHACNARVRVIVLRTRTQHHVSSIRVRPCGRALPCRDPAQPRPCGRVLTRRTAVEWYRRGTMEQQQQSSLLGRYIATVLVMPLVMSRRLRIACLVRSPCHVSVLDDVVYVWAGRLIISSPVEDHVVWT
jgi:hypothetical protein